jgi:hypothetical protein
MSIIGVIQNNKVKISTKKLQQFQPESIESQVIKPNQIEKIEGILNNMTQEKIEDYTEYFNKHGFIEINLNMSEIINKLLKSKRLPQPMKNMIENNAEDGNTTSEKLVHQLLHTFFGIFSLMLSIFVINSKQEPNNISIIFPKVLLSNDRKEFIDFLVSDFNKETGGFVSKKSIIIPFIEAILDGINLKTPNPEIRLLNIFNVLFTIVDIGINNIDEKFNIFDPNFMQKVVPKLLSQFVGNFPADRCIFNNSVISYENNVCNIKTGRKAANEVVAETETEFEEAETTTGYNKNMIYIGGAVVLLFIILFILYRRRK